MRSPRSFRAGSAASKETPRPESAPALLPPQQLSQPGAAAAVRWLEIALSPALESGACHHRSAGVGGSLAETRTRDRGMDDKALEELCKWHDEQAAMLRSEAGNLAAAAVAADMHAKTSAALHEAATEI